MRARGFRGGGSGKRRDCAAGDLRDQVRKIPWRRKWQPTPVLLPGEARGQRSLAPLRSMGSESDMTEAT